MHRSFLCSSNSMVRNNDHPSYNINAADDDEYIDIEVNTFSPKITNFQFQMTSNISTIFPADNLFYKGKLLPPRLQNSQNLLHSNQNSIIEEEEDEEDFIIMDFATTSSSSGHDDYFERSTIGLSSLMNNKHPEKSWSNKLRLIMKSLISKKLKASRAYLRALFRNSACKDAKTLQDYSNPAGAADNGKDFQLKYMKVEHKKSCKIGFMGLMWRQYPIIARVINKISKEGIEGHRRSFSLAEAAQSGLVRAHYGNNRIPDGVSRMKKEIKPISPMKCLAPSSSIASPSSFSSSSTLSSISFSSGSDFYELNLRKRSCSFTSDIEGTIEAAIAHCKKSQLLPYSGKTLKGHDASFTRAYG